MNDPLRMMGDWLIGQPELALLPAAVFLALYAARRRRLALIAGVTWLLYTLYEYGMRRRILCGGECDIRVDLLVIYPALLVLSVAALVATVWPARRAS